MAALSFETFMARTGRIVERMVGLDLNDMADCPYRDWHEAGYTPREAAYEVLVWNDAPDELLEMLDPDGGLA